MAKKYNISKTSGACQACGTELTPGTELVAMVTETDEGLQRLDFCQTCWRDNQDSRDAIAPLGTWRASVGQPSRKRKVFVDDELLINLFERLEGADAPGKINFRFVVALVLMRKKLLIYDGMSQADGQDIWQMHFRGGRESCQVVDPHMDDQKIAEVTSQLGEILEGQL